MLIRYVVEDRGGRYGTLVDYDVETMVACGDYTGDDHGRALMLAKLSYGGNIWAVWSENECGESIDTVYVAED